MLSSDDAQEAAAAEKYAVELGRRALAEGGLLSDGLRQELAVRAAERARREVLSSVEPSVQERHSAVDLAEVRQAASELSAALLVDIGAETLPVVGALPGPEPDPDPQSRQDDPGPESRLEPHPDDPRPEPRLDPHPDDPRPEPHPDDPEPEASPDHPDPEGRPGTSP